jgi:hypothetical protein
LVRGQRRDRSGTNRWLQKQFFGPLDRIITDTLSPAAAARIEEIDAVTYYADVFGNDGRPLRVPHDLDDSLCCYRDLTRENKAKFDRATFWLDLASRQWNMSVSKRTQAGMRPGSRRAGCEGASGGGGRICTPDRGPRHEPVNSKAAKTILTPDNLRTDKHCILKFIADFPPLFSVEGGPRLDGNYLLVFERKYDAAGFSRRQREVELIRICFTVVKLTRSADPFVEEQSQFLRIEIRPSCAKKFFRHARPLRCDVLMPLQSSNANRNPAAHPHRVDRKPDR